MATFSSAMQERTVSNMIRNRLHCMGYSRDVELARNAGDDGDGDDMGREEEKATLMSHEMAVLVSSQNMIRMIRKLHVAMLVLGIACLSVMIVTLVEEWYGGSR